MKNNSVKESSVKRAVKFWLDSSEDNFKAAQAMFDSGRWSLCMFMCQQTLEALLKAILIIETKDRPPYLHDLILLSKKCKVKIEENILEILIEANKHYIEARYKEERFNPEIYNEDSARGWLKKTKETIKWVTKKANLNI